MKQIHESQEKYAGQMKTSSEETSELVARTKYDRVVQFFATKSEGTILFYGLVIRVIALIYCIYHDNHVDHIKYTDVDYHVFTNGSKAIVEGRSPFDDLEYRYTPVVALIFTPNIYANVHLGKLLLIVADIIGGHLLYQLSIQQGTNRLKSKYYLALWMLNPMTVAISTRGSFEPILSLTILGSIHYLVKGKYALAGILYGLSIHFRIYPIIYCLTLYFYITVKRPYLTSEPRISYWLRTISPNTNHIKFFMASAISLILSSSISYKLYGHKYIEQSFLYHLRRKDLQHNFSPYFYMFRLYPKHQEIIGVIAFLAQFIGVTVVSGLNVSFDNNRRMRIRRLSFSLFTTTFIFVSLNKVCTSQYFIWYLIFVPLVLDSVDIGTRLKCLLGLTWTLTQVIWLVSAYLYEYQKMNTLHLVGCASLLFLVSNLWILRNFCSYFKGVTIKRD